MPGRRLLDEENLFDPGYGLHRPGMVRRREVLRETLDRLREASPPGKYHAMAERNLEAWSKPPRATSSSRQSVRVLSGDWGEVTLELTRDHGACFAVLNMANAYVPGGAYVEGAKAQEENMFRRTDCHFRIGTDEYDRAADRYRPEWTSLISGENGRVYLDTENQRVCLRGPEDRSRSDLGYEWLSEEQIFPFYELRSAAKDLRDGSPFSPSAMRKRIAAQLDTLIKQGVRHVVLGAFGCGAFRNPAESVAGIYREQISERRSHFTVIAFAIYHAGYGPSNFEPFSSVFSRELVLG
jgi:hypothetical protein